MMVVTSLGTYMINLGEPNYVFLSDYIFSHEWYMFINYEKKCMVGVSIYWEMKKVQSQQNVFISIHAINEECELVVGTLRSWTA